MNIAIFIPDLRGGGAERVSINLADAFTALGHRTEFVLMRAEGDFLQEAEERFSVVSLGITRVRHIPFALSQYLCEKHPDVLIANIWPLTVMSALGRFISKKKIYLLLVEHSIISKQYRSWGMAHMAVMRLSMISLYRSADIVAGVSTGVAKDIARLSHFSSDQVRILYNPIPVRSEPSAEAVQKAEALWNCEVSARILTVGSFKEVKNHALLLRAFALMPHGTAKLMLLGQGQKESDLKKLVAELGIADDVIFGGFHADPAAFYHTADLFVLSSDYEGFGNVIVEALSFGLPVVSTDCPSGPAEILENGRYGRLTPVGDAPALAKAMEEALAETVDREALKRRAADFSPEKAARKYLEAMGLA